MLDIGGWSLARVGLASVLWVALNIALPVAVIYLWIRTARSTGSGGIGAVAASTFELALIVLYLFGPPIALTLYWVFVRRS